MLPKLTSQRLVTCSFRRFSLQASPPLHHRPPLSVCLRKKWHPQLFQPSSTSLCNIRLKSDAFYCSIFFNSFHSHSLWNKDKSKEPSTSAELFSEAIEEVGKTAHLKEKEEKLVLEKTKKTPSSKPSPESTIEAKPIPTQAVARRKNIPISWKKLMVLCRLIRGCTVKEALRRLVACPRPAAAIVARIVKQAHNNAVALGLGSDFSFPSKTKKWQEFKKQKQQQKQNVTASESSSVSSTSPSTTSTTSSQLFASLPTVSSKESDNPLVIAHAITGRSYYVKKLDIRARGRSGIRRKPHSHLTIIVQHKKDLPAYKNYLKRKERRQRREQERQQRRLIEPHTTSTTQTIVY